MSEGERGSGRCLIPGLSLEAAVQREFWIGQDVDIALGIVRQALHDEITGQRFYNDAAFYCIDPWAKEIFASLAKEEEVHTRLLLLEYESLETRGLWLDLEGALASSTDVDIARLNLSGVEFIEQLFSPQVTVGQAINRTTDDLQALVFGMTMEKSAINLYGRAAKEALQPAGQEIYGFLVDEEYRHYQRLAAQWQNLVGAPFEGL